MHRDGTGHERRGSGRADSRSRSLTEAERPHAIPLMTLAAGGRVPRQSFCAKVAHPQQCRRRAQARTRPGSSPTPRLFSGTRARAQMKRIARDVGRRSGSASPDPRRSLIRHFCRGGGPKIDERSARWRRMGLVGTRKLGAGQCDGRPALTNATARTTPRLCSNETLKGRRWVRGPRAGQFPGVSGSRCGERVGLVRKIIHRARGTVECGP